MFAVLVKAGPVILEVASQDITDSPFHETLRSANQRLT